MWVVVGKAVTLFFAERRLIYTSGGVWVAFNRRERLGHNQMLKVSLQG